MAAVSKNYLDLLLLSVAIKLLPESNWQYNVATEKVQINELPRILTGIRTLDDAHFNTTYNDIEGHDMIDIVFVFAQKYVIQDTLGKGCI